MRDDNQHFLNNDVVLALQIAVPVAFMDMIAALAPAARLTAISFLELRLDDWVPILCAIWVLFVLNCGPFGTSRPPWNASKGVNRCR